MVNKYENRIKRFKAKRKKQVRKSEINRRKEIVREKKHEA